MFLQLLVIFFPGFLWKDKPTNNARVALANRDLPLEKLVLETDVPYMYARVFFSFHYSDIIIFR